MNVEQLKPQELDEHARNGTSRLAFVGMSNGGKSYRSRVLQEELDFFWYEVDSCIQKSLSVSSIDDISEWLGYPTSETYTARAAAYLNAEEKCTHLKDIDTGGKNLVFDTTGSVIYLSGETKDWLLHECLVVNVDVGEGALERLTEKYFEQPKPVIWGDMFSLKVGETEQEAIRRCYPELLRTRLEEYRNFAHLSIPLDELFDTTGVETLEVIKKYL